MNKCQKCGYETTPMQIKKVGLCRICENKQKAKEKRK